MRTLTVTRTIPAAIDDVFDAYTDHEQLSKVAGVRCWRLAREGDTEKNRLGAIREVDCGAIWLREEITGFDRPQRMVTWSTRFGARLPGGDSEELTCPR